MEVLGFIVGAAALTFAFISLGKISALEKQLTEAGVLKDERE